MKLTRKIKNRLRPSSGWDYTMFVHPNQLRDLRIEDLKSGEIGRYEAIRFIKSLPVVF